MLSRVARFSLAALSRSYATATAPAPKKPVRVAVTGAAGAIAYSLLFRIAHGDMLGKDQPVILHCLDVPMALNKMKGVAMELADCAFPLLRDIVVTENVDLAFKDVDYALLVGARPRGVGMERSDLLRENADIFSVQGKSLNERANRNVKVLVVGNPANTNALIAASNAPDLDSGNFTAMTRLDQNRAMAMLATELKVNVGDIDRVVIWGNHSSTMYPDVSSVTVKGEPVADRLLGDELRNTWVHETFIPQVAQRGAAIINARGASSAASAASAAIDHMRDWVLGSGGRWVSMAIPSDGSYGVKPGVMFSVPVICENGKYTRVQGLKIPSRERFAKTERELFEERALVKHLLGSAASMKA